MGFKTNKIKKPQKNVDGKKFPIKRVKQGKRHPHVVVLENDKEFISVGLTSSNTRGDLIKVKYTNGNVAYMKRTATRQKSNLYENKNEKYYLEKKSEDKAYRIAINKLLKDINKKK